jgi:hypothetical protein
MNNDDEIVGTGDAAQDETPVVESTPADRVSDEPPPPESTRQESLLPRATSLRQFQPVNPPSGPKEISAEELAVIMRGGQKQEKTEGEVTRERTLELERQVADLKREMEKLRGQFEATQKKPDAAATRADPRTVETIFPVRLTSDEEDGTWVERHFTTGGTLTDMPGGRQCTGTTDPCTVTLLDADDRLLFGQRVGGIMHYLVFGGSAGSIVRWNDSTHSLEQSFDGGSTWENIVTFEPCPTNLTPITGDELLRAGLTSLTGDGQFHVDNTILGGTIPSVDPSTAGGLR